MRTGCGAMAENFRSRALSAALFLLGSIALPVPAGSAAEPPAPLALEATIRLEGVRGRIDHLAIDSRRGRLIVAELGNDTVDVVDLASGKPIHRIAGLRGPQGVAYEPKADLVFVADAGDGTVRMFRAGDLTPVGFIGLGDDADNIHLDPRNGLVVVGYGNGGLAVIDPWSRARLAAIALPAHPEGFQIDAGNGRAYVNIPDARRIAVVDLDLRRIVATWPMPVAANFPMAFSAQQGLLASVFRSPPSLMLFDVATGTMRQALPACGAADDVFFDDRRQRIYVSCGTGEVSVFQRATSGWARRASVRTAAGARTALFVPELDRLLVAERAGRSGSEAAILVYRPAP